MISYNATVINYYVTLLLCCFFNFPEMSLFSVDGLCVCVCVLVIHVPKRDGDVVKISVVASELEGEIHPRD